MKAIVLAISLLIIAPCFSQIRIPSWATDGKSISISKVQSDVITDMAKGEQLFKTAIGQQLVEKAIYEGQIIYDHRNVHKPTFKALLRKKIIVKRDKNPKDKGCGEYILTDLGEEINHYLSS